MTLARLTVLHLASWSEARALEFMDDAGIDAAVTSNSTPRVHVGDGARARSLRTPKGSARITRPKSKSGGRLCGRPPSGRDYGANLNQRATVARSTHSRSVSSSLAGRHHQTALPVMTDPISRFTSVYGGKADTATHAAGRVPVENYPTGTWASQSYCLALRPVNLMSFAENLILQRRC